jgi:hypothetical protein
MHHVFSLVGDAAFAEYLSGLSSHRSAVLEVERRQIGPGVVHADYPRISCVAGLVINPPSG